MDNMRDVFQKARSGIRRIKAFRVLETPEGKAMNEELNKILDRLHELEDPNTIPGGLDPDRHSAVFIG